jgi:hypothetical protein
MRVLDAGVAAVPQLQVGELAAGPAAAGVGEEPGDAHSVGVGGAQLGAGVEAFFAQDQPSPGRPPAQRDQAGGLGDPGPVTGLDLGAGLGGGACALLPPARAKQSGTVSRPTPLQLGQLLVTHRTQPRLYLRPRLHLPSRCTRRSGYGLVVG